MSAGELHAAVKRGDLERIRAVLAQRPKLVNTRTPDPRGTYPLHVAAEFGHAAAAQVLLDHGADVSLLDAENDDIALGWAAFFGRPEVVRVLLDAGSDANERNKHGLTPLGCAIGGTQGKWQQFSNASIDDWKACADALSAAGARE